MRWRRHLALTLVTLAAYAQPADRRLADAAQRGDKTAVVALLKSAKPDSTQPDGCTALHWAAERDDLEMAGVLLDAGAPVAAVNRYGVMPLSLAAANGSEAMIRLLLKKGAKASAALPGGETVLMTAARTGKLAAVEALLDAGADVAMKEERYGQTALMWAAAEGHAPVVRALIAAGSDFKLRLPSGFTAYLFAVREGKQAAADVLLDAGADVNETVEPAPTTVRKPMGLPRAGISALVLAVTNGHFALASHLLDRGADPNAAKAGYTALHAITNTRKPGVGDNNPPPDGSGELSSSDMVRKLVAKGANLNARMTKRVAFGLTALNTLGATPYFLAAKTADAPLMRLLVSLGADPTINNAANSTPLMAISGLGTRSPGEDAGTEEEVLEAIDLALQQGADINAVDDNGETAMHGAAYKNHPRAVELLAKRGAKPEIWNRPNKQGWTPLVIAEGHRFGNYKPSPVTVEAFHRVMTASGLEIPPPAVRTRD
jgi:ankyrin repeat protein